MFFKQAQKLLLIFGTVSEKVGFHIQITSMSFFIFIQVKLIEDGRFILIENIPAYAGVVGDQHAAPHQHFVDCSFSKRNQMDPWAFGLELIGVFLEFSMKIEIYLQIIFFQQISQLSGIQKSHIMGKVVACFKVFIRNRIKPVSPGWHDHNFPSVLRFVMKYVPSGQTGVDHFFRLIAKII